MALAHALSLVARARPLDEAPPPTDLVERVLLELAPAHQAVYGGLAMLFGIGLCAIAMRSIEDRVPRPPPPPTPPPLSSLPAHWPPLTRALAGVAIRLGFGPPRSFTPVLLPLAFLVWFAATMLGASLTRAAADAGGAGVTPERLHAAGATFLLVAALLLGFLLLWTRLFGDGPADLGLRREGLLPVLLMALLFYACFLPVQFGAIALESGLRGLLDLPTDGQVAVALFAEHPQLRRDWVVLAGITLAAPLHEELLFRGVLQRYLGRLFPTALALLLNGVLFASLHDGGLLAVGVLGVALAWLMHRTGNLAAPLLFHIVHNGLTLALIAASAGRS
ncbi:MAG: CPBP family intramembrane metalloprotease [Planctomycetes bacterium]|nr:CPBP family intramembrane metalloprotease [Planctomycetota bacterium]